MFFSFFFFNDTATTEIYTLSLHDALPILLTSIKQKRNLTVLITTHYMDEADRLCDRIAIVSFIQDRKSTRLNSSHSQISYAVFCLKKKKTNNRHPLLTCLRT